MTTPGRESTESTGFLYPFIESEETDAEQSSRRPLRIRQRQGRRKCPPATGVAGRVRTGTDHRGHRDGRTVPARRPALHIGQRGQLHRRGDTGVAVQPPGAGARGGGLVAGRRRGGGDGPRQRRRLRAHLQTADHRPRPRPRRRHRVVDLRQLRGPDDGHHRGQTAGIADDRVLRPRRRAEWRWPRISTTASRCTARASTASRRATPCSVTGSGRSRRNTCPVPVMERTLHEHNRRNDRRPTRRPRARADRQVPPAPPAAARRRGHARARCGRKVVGRPGRRRVPRGVPQRRTRTAR